MKTSFEGLYHPDAPGQNALVNLNEQKLFLNGNFTFSLQMSPPDLRGFYIVHPDATISLFPYDDVAPILLYITNIWRFPQVEEFRLLWKEKGIRFHRHYFWHWFTVLLMEILVVSSLWGTSCLLWHLLHQNLASPKRMISQMKQVLPDVTIDSRTFWCILLLSVIDKIWEYQDVVTCGPLRSVCAILIALSINSSCLTTKDTNPILSASTALINSPYQKKWWGF